MTALAPVITVDGPSGAGKGTISQRIAKTLNWHFLDSGALYRLLALAATNAQVDWDDKPALARLAQTLDAHFGDAKTGHMADIYLNGAVVTKAIRTEACGNNASKVGAIPMVRAALLDRQRQFRQAPGLVADGRDMGTVIFPDATLKIFLEASVAVRAQRRLTQLKEMGQSVSLQQLSEEIAERDARDRNRLVSPLKPADDAIIIDTSELSVEAVYAQVTAAIQKAGLL